MLYYIHIHTGLLNADGGAEESGRHLVRSKDGTTTYLILSVIYKGQPTHHALVFGDDGEFTLNKVPTGCSSLRELLEKYRSKQPKWPVPLTTGVQNATSKNDSALSSDVSDDSASAKEVTEVVSALQKDDGGPESSPHFHPNIDKAAAEALLLADGGADISGKYLIRQKGGKDSNDSLIISVIYKGNPTHHALMRDEPGAEWSVNKSPTGCSSIVSLIEKYGSKQPKWPVPLTEGVPGPGTSSKSLPATILTESISSEIPSKVSQPASVPDTASGYLEVGNTDVPDTNIPDTNTAVDADFEYYNPKINKAQAEDLLGSGQDGKYLIRLKGPSSTDAFILSVIYKGSPTHHSLIRDSAGSEFSLNKTPTGCTTFSSLVAKYASKQPRWPVPLVEGVPTLTHSRTSVATASNEVTPEQPTLSAKTVAPPKLLAAPEDPVENITPVLKKTVRKVTASDTLEDAQAALAEAQAELREANAAAAAKRVAAEREANTAPKSYMFGEMTRDESEALVAGKPDGAFLIRERAEEEGYIMCVVFRGKPSHHSVAKNNETMAFEINGKPMGGFRSIPEMIDYMSRPLPNWPVPLNADHVRNPNTAAFKPVISASADVAKIVELKRAIAAAETRISDLETAALKSQMEKRRAATDSVNQTPTQGKLAGRSTAVLERELNLAETNLTIATENNESAAAFVAAIRVKDAAARDLNGELLECVWYGLSAHEAETKINGVGIAGAYMVRIEKETYRTFLVVKEANQV